MTWRRSDEKPDEYTNGLLPPGDPEVSNQHIWSLAQEREKAIQEAYRRHLEGDKTLPVTQASCADCGSLYDRDKGHVCPTQVRIDKARIAQEKARAKAAEERENKRLHGATGQRVSCPRCGRDVAQSVFQQHLSGNLPSLPCDPRTTEGLRHETRQALIAAAEGRQSEATKQSEIAELKDKLNRLLGNPAYLPLNKKEV